MALTEVEESRKDTKPREPDKPSTPVRKKVKRYEDLNSVKEGEIRSPRIRSSSKKFGTRVKWTVKSNLESKGSLGRQSRSNVLN